MPGEQHFIEIIQPSRPTFVVDATPAESELVRAHLEYLNGLMAAGKLIMAGRTDDAAFGMVILKASSLADARAMAMADPAVQAGVFLLKEVKLFRVALWNATA